ncbi:17570_t:CDS:2, partial [Entrophospora sp. SA101]
MELISLWIGVVNLQNISCAKHIPTSLISYIQEQLTNENNDIIYFDEFKHHRIQKLELDVDEDVKNYLTKFENITILEELRIALDNSP